MMLRKALVVLAVLALTVVAASPADAGRVREKPFRFQYVTQVDPMPEGIQCSDELVPFRATGSGTASHLGRIDVLIEACSDGFVLEGTSVGTAKFTAANGDELVIGFEGEYTTEFVTGTPLTAVSVLEAPAIPEETTGTGRFAHAKVTGINVDTSVYDLFTLTGTGTGVGSGTIAYDASDRANR